MEEWAEEEDEDIITNYDVDTSVSTEAGSSSSATRKIRNNEKALVVDGDTLKFVLKRHLKDFILLAKNCASVICCRTGPLQKVSSI